MLASDVCSWPGYIVPERSPAILLAHYCNLECIVGAETPCGKVKALNTTNSLQIPFPCDDGRLFSTAKF